LAIALVRHAVSRFQISPSNLVAADINLINNLMMTLPTKFAGGRAD